MLISQLPEILRVSTIVLRCARWSMCRLMSVANTYTIPSSQWRHPAARPTGMDSLLEYIKSYNYILQCYELL